eukprot:3921746-Rhodomonas_salina.1
MVVVMASMLAEGRCWGGGAQRKRWWGQKTLAARETAASRMATARMRAVRASSERLHVRFTSSDSHTSSSPT